MYLFPKILHPCGDFQTSLHILCCQSYVYVSFFFPACVDHTSSKTDTTEQIIHCGWPLLSISSNKSLSSQYYALQILEAVIKTRWKILPRHQCEGKICLTLNQCYRDVFQFVNREMLFGLSNKKHMPCFQESRNMLSG